MMLDAPPRRYTDMKQLGGTIVKNKKPGSISSGTMIAQIRF